MFVLVSKWRPHTLVSRMWKWQERYLSRSRLQQRVPNRHCILGGLVPSPGLLRHYEIMYLQPSHLSMLRCSLGVPVTKPNFHANFLFYVTTHAAFFIYPTTWKLRIAVSCCNKISGLVNLDILPTSYYYSLIRKMIIGVSMTLAPLGNKRQEEFEEVCRYVNFYIWGEQQKCAFGGEKILSLWQQTRRVSLKCWFSKLVAKSW